MKPGFDATDQNWRDNQMSGGTMILQGHKSIGKNRIHLKSCSLLIMILTVFLSLIQFLWEIVWMEHIAVTFWSPSTTSCPDLLNSQPIMVHDGVHSHIAAPVVNLLHRWNWEILEHPSYSADMSDFDLFAKWNYYPEEFALEPDRQL